jgi:hypothetical protein
MAADGVGVKTRPWLATPAAWGVVALWLPYTLLNTWFPGPALTYTLGLALTALALTMLWLGGLSPHALFLRRAPLSRPGAAILGALLLFIPAALLLGRGQPFDPLADLVYAPASALGQELFFRSALLVALLRLCGGRARLALLLQACAFALWHVRAFEVAGIGPAAGVLLVTFAAGALWGTQVQRDRTVLYAIAEHTLFLIVQ